MVFHENIILLYETTLYYDICESKNEKSLQQSKDRYLGQPLSPSLEHFHPISEGLGSKSQLYF